jgi:hypothetical protein
MLVWVRKRYMKFVSRKRNIDIKLLFAYSISLFLFTTIWGKNKVSHIKKKI